jgi:hypothetical protein
MACAKWLLLQRPGCGCGAMQAGLRNGEIHHYFEKQHSCEPVQACIRDWLDAQRGK